MKDETRGWQRRAIECLDCQGVVEVTAHVHFWNTLLGTEDTLDWRQDTVWRHGDQLVCYELGNKGGLK